jgi:hypothetical protein
LVFGIFDGLEKYMVICNAIRGNVDFENIYHTKFHIIYVSSVLPSNQKLKECLFMATVFLFTSLWKVTSIRGCCVLSKVCWHMPSQDSRVKVLHVVPLPHVCVSGMLWLTFIPCLVKVCWVWEGGYQYSLISVVTWMYHKCLALSTFPILFHIISSGNPCLTHMYQDTAWFQMLANSVAPESERMQ